MPPNIPGKTAEPTPEKLDATPKVKKKEAEYRKAEKGMSCGNCANFLPPNKCSVVAGNIDPLMLSNRYMPLEGEALMDNAAPMGLM